MKKITALCLWLGPLVLALFVASPAPAQEAEDVGLEQEVQSLRTEVDGLKRRQGLILRQLQEIRTALQGRQQAARPSPISDLKGAVLAVGDDPFKGAADAKVVMIEFSDYECPYCARHTGQSLPQIVRDYVATGKLKYVFNDFPLESIHKQAFKAAQAAHCAGDQGKYWEMHDRFFANQRALGALTPHAEALGLDVAAFDTCLADEKYAAKVRGNMAQARKLGVTATPTFVLGISEDGGSTVKGLRLVRGALPYQHFKQEIDRLLASEAG